MSARPSFADYEPTVERLLGRGIGNDEFAYPWEFDEEGVALCVLQHKPQEYGGFAHPDLSEDCSLRYCFVGDTDIRSIVSQDHRRRIERMALDELKAERRKRECEEFDAEAA